MTSAPAEKEKSITAATTAASKAEAKYDHLSAPASAMASGTATPAEKEKEEAKKEEKADVKKEESSGEEESSTASKSAKKYEHLSVPASALQSGTATPADSDDMENAFKETPTKEEAEKVFPDIASVAAGVQDMQLGEGKTANEQEAKKAEDAVKSVED